MQGNLITWASQNAKGDGSALPTIRPVPGFYVYLNGIIYDPYICRRPIRGGVEYLRRANCTTPPPLSTWTISQCAMLTIHARKEWESTRRRSRSTRDSYCIHTFTSATSMSNPDGVIIEAPADRDTSPFISKPPSFPLRLRMGNDLGCGKTLFRGGKEGGLGLVTKTLPVASSNATSQR
ncbi:uncharacterized protein LY79DRAFT_308015 [Colletotrichum navitas]|uniref:Uncharacterized protein n=1 Tax=Colletotrichum navitas TaxID=681940 RepID=A0AAD8PTV3_9PEZI|nr:uncharacterized protein LY79DRAFT_308015 [Colletotrichum navitas]KAK1580451.1 hypothetical protein LY79DRAFT_308015 [Colletotrichum navitas]